MYAAHTNATGTVSPRNAYTHARVAIEVSWIRAWEADSLWKACEAAILADFANEVRTVCEVTLGTGWKTRALVEETWDAANAACFVQTLQAGTYAHFAAVALDIVQRWKASWETIGPKK